MQLNKFAGLNGALTHPIFFQAIFCMEQIKDCSRFGGLKSSHHSSLIYLSTYFPNAF